MKAGVDGRIVAFPREQCCFHQISRVNIGVKLCVGMYVEERSAPLTDSKFGVDESIADTVNVPSGFPHLLRDGNVLHMFCWRRCHLRCLFCGKISSLYSYIQLPPVDNSNSCHK